MPYRGKKQMLFKALTSDTERVSVPSRDPFEDDDVLYGIKWRTFYRYIKDFRKDGYPVLKEGDEYFIIPFPDSGGEVDEKYTVCLSYVQMKMLEDMLQAYCEGFEIKDLKKDSLIRSIWEEIDASLHGNQEM